MNKTECLNLFERYIQHKATAEDVSHLKQFIITDSKLNIWLEQQICDSNDNMDKQLKMKILSNLRAGIAMQSPKPLKMRLWIMRIAGVLILPMLMVAAYYIWTDRLADYQELIVSTDSGESANVILPDGSKAYLNSTSTLVYNTNYNRRDRQLKLNGEAYFDVVTDKSKVFIIDCQDMRIEVLGTSFGVKAYDEDVVISATLTSGKVKLMVPGDTVIMKPNEKVSYDRNTKKLTTIEVNAAHYTNWKSERLRFENETLEDILRTISRVHNITVSFADESLKTQRFTGTIDNSTIVKALDAIKITSPLDYRINNGVYVFYEDKKGIKHFRQNM